MIEYITNIELGIMQWLHMLLRNPILDEIFLALTFMGNEVFIVLAFPLVWQITNRVFSVRFGTFLLLALSVAFLLKGVFQRDRPYLLVPSLQGVPAWGFSFPSGHALFSVIFWGLLADYVKKTSFTYFALAMIILVSFSRIYLGVHYPTDIACGMLIGGITLWLYRKLPHILDIDHTTKKYLKPTILVVMANVALLWFHNNHDFVHSVAIYSGITLGTIILARLYPHIMDEVGTHHAMILAFNAFLGLLGAYLIHKYGKEIKAPLAGYFRYFTLGLWVGCVSDLLIYFLHNKVTHRILPPKRPVV